jgi:hypothetical protein
MRQIHYARKERHESGIDINTIPFCIQSRGFGFRAVL